MRKINNKVTLLNIMTLLLLQIVTAINSFVVSRTILSVFGSDVNGLISSLTQFLSYITLIEGGVSGIIIANLYKPLIEKDDYKISMILKTANTFFKKIGFIFLIYTFALATIYPIVIKTSFNFNYIFFMTIILSFNLFIQYMFSLTYKNLLTADKKIYVVSIIQALILILNTVLTIVLTKFFPNIHILKLLTGLVYFIQPLLFNFYVRKHYNLNFKVPVNESLIEQRWNSFAINIASFIHGSTDITILTIFSNLSIVSVYSIYSLVVTGLKQIINSFASGITPTIGQSFAKHDFDDVNKKINIYEFIVVFLVFYLFSIAALLITPFVLLYTNGVKDINYNQPLFGVLLLLSEAIYLLKLPHLNLAYSANKFKEITIPAFVEAFINIIISIILVHYLGLIGVAIGTIIAMLYRMFFHVYYTKKLIHRNQWLF